MCIRRFGLRSFSGIKSRNSDFYSRGSLTKYEYTYSQIFHEALLLKEISHFCYSRACYTARLAQNSVIDCILHTWNCDPKTEFCLYFCVPRWL